MAISSFVPMKKAIFALIDGAPDLVDVDRSYEWPTAAKKEEGVWLGGTADWDQEWATLATTHPRDDLYTVDLFIESIRPNQSQVEADERVHDLLTIVGSLLQPVGIPPVNWPMSLDVGQVVNLQLKPHQWVGGIAGDEGYGARVEAGIRCKVRLHQ